MSTHISFPSINQFRNTIKVVQDRAKYHEVPIPKLKFKGSVKLHGMNVGIVRDTYANETWCQSREQIITPEADSTGFAVFALAKKDYIQLLLNLIAGVYGNNKIQPGDLIAVYGEWCGKGIQKGVAINQLQKMFVVFGAAIVKPVINDDGSHNRVWLTSDQLIDVADGFGAQESKDSGIYHIQKFPTWEIEIDFAHPELAQNELVALTQEVENLCPVGKAFGVEGVGEGIVWECVSIWNFPVVPDELDVKIKTSDLRFKVKGAKHSDTKVKKLASVDIEKINSINEFAKNVVTDHRLEKMLEKLIAAGFELESKNTGEFLKLVGADVIKEEADTLEANGLDRKAVMTSVNLLARQWFLKKC
jgi:hypothetical protein